MYTLISHRSTCGRRNVDGVSVRIVGSNDASQTQFGEWPHTCVVSERREEDGTWRFVAGASLIDEGVVLTAAHKVE